MPMLKIPRHRWSTFLDTFSRQHAGCLCTLEVTSRVTGPGTEATTWPLLRLNFESGHEGPQVQVFVGDRLERDLCHSLLEPRHVWLDETSEGKHAGVRIEAADGIIHLRFRKPQEPEYREPYYVERHLP